VALRHTKERNLLVHLSVGGHTLFDRNETRPREHGLGGWRILGWLALENMDQEAVLSRLDAKPSDGVSGERSID